MSNTRRLRARWVVPVDLPPISFGEVVISGDRIVEVRTFDSSLPIPPDVTDYGNAIIMPGLVNVHTHLDYTVMRGFLEDIDFFPWIRELTISKAALDQDDWIASATVGAAEAVAGGVTTIGDCTTTGAALDGAMALGLRGIIYQEVFGIDQRVPVAETIRELVQQIDALKLRAGPLFKIGVSPHSPYTVSVELFRELSKLVAERGLRVCIHAAESRAESELLMNGRGVIAEMYDRRGIEFEHPGSTTVKYLFDLGMLGEKTLLVHGVQIVADDLDTTRNTKTAWAHCPKSNSKLGNGVAPLQLMQNCYPDGESRVGLGSDSVASNNTMDMFEEMRFAVLTQRAANSRFDAMTAKQAVDMATIQGARALGMDHQISSLTPGKLADIAVVNLNAIPNQPAFDPLSALVYSVSARDVDETIVGGETVYRTGKQSMVVCDAIANMLLAADKLVEFRKGRSDV